MTANFLYHQNYNIIDSNVDITTNMLIPSYLSLTIRPSHEKREVLTREIIMFSSLKLAETTQNRLEIVIPAAVLGNVFLIVLLSGLILFAYLARRNRYV